MDVGRQNIGIGVSNEKGECVFLCNVKTDNKQVTRHMKERKAHRMERRQHHRQKKQRKALATNNQIKNGNDNILRSKKDCKSINVSYPKMEKYHTHKVIKGKEARFANRKVMKGKLTPSAINLIQIHVNALKRVASFLPIKYVVIEDNIFDFQKLENCDIEAWAYTYGILHGFRDYKDYISKQQNFCCLLCGKKKIDHYHHIIPKKQNGSNNVANIAGLCEKCHALVHTDSSYKEKLKSKKQGIRKKYEIGLLNSCMDNIIEEISKLYPTTCTTGYETSKLRKELGLEKDHCYDEYIISLRNNQNKENIKPKILSKQYTMKHFKKKCGSIIWKLNSREYYYNGKLVATNRHKGFEQDADSLEEYRNEYLLNHTQKEWDRHFHELVIKPAKRTYTYRKNDIAPKFKCGDVIKYEKHNKIKGNTKQKIFVATEINNSKEKICCGTKSSQMKFCQSLQRHSLEFV
jgi:hypothetical protein